MTRASCHASCLCLRVLTDRHRTRLELLNRTDGDDTPKGDDWPRLLFRNETMNPDNMWDGFLQNEILIKVCECYVNMSTALTLLQAAKCILTSPSSVDKDNDVKTTRNGKAKRRGIEKVTIGFIAFITSTVSHRPRAHTRLTAMRQLRFALTSYDSYSLSHGGLDVDGFYSSLYDLLIDPDEQEEVQKLLDWWTRYVHAIPYEQPLIRCAGAFSARRAAVIAVRPPAPAPSSGSAGLP